MTINRLGAVASLVGLTFCVFNACTSRPTKSESPIGASFVTPSPEELYVKGRVQVKKDANEFLDEDHYGEELDLSQRRPAVDLRGTIYEQKYGAPDTLLIGNFYHQGRFFVARVPVRAVKNVYFQFTYFTSSFEPKTLAGFDAVHSALRFELEAPIQLVIPMPDEAELATLAKAPASAEIPLLPEAMTGEESLVRNVAISAEPQWVKGDRYKRYDFKRGMLGAYTSIVRFMSMQEKLEEFFESGHPITQVKFELKDEKGGDAILAEALRTSHTDGLGKLHDTYWYNCTTLAFEIVERGERTKDERIERLRGYMQTRKPAMASSKLEAHGGIEATPVALDPTLLDEAEEAYQDKIAMKKRVLCPDEFESTNCDAVKVAVDFLKKEGRL